MGLNFLTIILGTLPGLIWLLFYLQEDRHPEPKRLILTTFAMGAFMAIPVVIAQLLTQDLLKFLNIANLIIPIFALALIEEFFKFAAAYWIARGNAEFDEPIDAMIYTVTAALGFATVENLLIVSNVFYLQTPAVSASVFSASALRFIGATLLHALASGLMGYYWARGIIEKSPVKNLSFGLALAVLTHAVFNLLILKFQNANFLYPSLFLILVAIAVLIDFEKLRKMV